MSTPGDNGRVRKRVGISVGIVVLVAGAVYIGVHWSELGLAPVVGRRHLWDQILGTAEVALAIRLAVLAGAFYLLASVVGLTIQGRWVAKITKEGVETDPAATLRKQQETFEAFHAKHVETRRVGAPFESGLGGTLRKDLSARGGHRGFP